jgi:hypothetical protein
MNYKLAFLMHKNRAIGNGCGCDDKIKIGKHSQPSTIHLPGMSPLIAMLGKEEGQNAFV